MRNSLHQNTSLKQAEESRPDFIVNFAAYIIQAIIIGTPFALYYVFERPSLSQKMFFNLSVFTLLIIVSSFLLFKKSYVNIFRKFAAPFFVIVSAGILFQVISCFKSPIFLYSFKSMFSVLAGFLFFAVLYNFNFSKKQIAGFNFWFAAGAFSVALYGILQYAGIEFLQYSEEAKVEKFHILSLLGHPNYVAAFIAPIFFICIADSITLKNKAGKIFELISAFLILVCVILAGTRGAWAGMTVSGIIFAGVLLLYSGKLAINKRLLRIVFLAVILIGAGSLFLLTKKYSLTDRIGEKEPVLGRFYSWMIAGEMFKKSPVIGIGAGNFEAQFWDYASDFQDKPGNAVYEFMFENAKGSPPGYVHNEFLQMLAENGAAGFILFVMALIMALDIFRKNISGGLHDAGNVFLKKSREANSEAAVQNIEKLKFPQKSEGLSFTQGEESSANLHNSEGLKSVQNEKQYCAIQNLGLFAALLTLIIDALFNFTFHLPASAMLFWYILSRARTTKN